MVIPSEAWNLVASVFPFRVIPDLIGDPVLYLSFRGSSAFCLCSRAIPGQSQGHASWRFLLRSGHSERSACPERSEGTISRSTIERKESV